MKTSMKKVLSLFSLSIASVMLFNNIAFAAITGGDANLSYFKVYDGLITEYTDYTSEAITEDDGDISHGSFDQIFYFGLTSGQFDELYVDTNSTDSGSTLDIEYWDGNSWENLSVSGGNPWDNTGEDSITFTAPGGWATTTIDGSDAAYWIRQNSSDGNGGDAGLSAVVDQYKVTAVAGAAPEFSTYVYFGVIIMGLYFVATRPRIGSGTAAA
jgi:hypothetical protein